MKEVKKNVLVNGEKVAIVKVLEGGTADKWYLVQVACYKDAEHICRVEVSNLFNDRSLDTMKNTVLNYASKFLYEDTFTVSL